MPELQPSAPDDGSRLRAELERLVYAVSHDFSEPVQVAVGCARLLGNRLEGKLDPDAERLLGALARSGARLQRMIDELLAYSRIDRTPLMPEPVDCAEALADACARLEGSIAGSGARIEAEALPTIAGDGGQVEQVFQNLLANAIAFRSESPPVVRIDAEPDPAGWRVSVRDNGRGIDPAIQERIFELFQCGDRTDPGSGQGVGLAICRRIVERHHGQIGVHSLPGEGATFFFTLPAMPAAGAHTA